MGARASIPFLVALLAAGCGGSEHSSPGPTGTASTHPGNGSTPYAPLRQTTRPSVSSSHIVTWSSAGRTVRLNLIAGMGSGNNGFNFNGYGRGELTVTIPLGWRVNASCENQGARYHSCAVVTGPMTTRLAFPGASTPDPTRGLAPGAEASFSFVASRVGVYRIACLVPGHEEARMWDVLRVVNAGKPSTTVRPGP
ncbi:MAG: sulfocyanin-like copper-binding protein [Gaiellaceae bacterium]